MLIDFPHEIPLQSCILKFEKNVDQLISQGFLYFSHESKAFVKNQLGDYIPLIKKTKRKEHTISISSKYKAPTAVSIHFSQRSIVLVTGEL